ncbi:Hypothetical predicted protein [Paramuricea clavata]|uniref:Uncharacterized protein n=1 Tax=Paramuricea clavata TaxID=317549 RepID=A0A7D9ERQ6_PARCT|nr:Hypothetical predicted protein [Paramuricea clavata]
MWTFLDHKVTSVLPFYDRTCHTVAGLALKIYRRNFLREEQICQVPACGYGGKNINQSGIALRWLREIESELAENNRQLASKLAVGGEVEIMGRYGDHDDEEHVLYGTWTSVEIQKAIELGVIGF